MTKNDNENITDAKLESAEKKQSLNEKIARGAIKAFNAGLRGIGFTKQIDIDNAINGIKAGTITPNELLGWAEEITKALGTGLKVLSGLKSGAKKIPVFGPVLSEVLKWTGKALTLGSGVIDRMKDTCMDLAISSLALKVGKAQKGISDVNDKVDKQGKAMKDGFDKLSGKLADTKSELEGKLAGHGQQIGQLQSQGQRLESSLNNLSQAHSQFKQETQAQFEEVNERIDTTEVKITKNARDILEEKLEREAIDNELRDKIKENKLHLNNLQETQEELREDFQSYQSKTDRKLDEVQQEIENTQEEFQQQLKIQETKIQLELEQTKDEFEQANNLINTKIHQTQEILEEYEEEVNNIHHQQQRLNTEFQELTDDVETQFDLIHQQQRQLNLVSDQMQEITEETNKRMDKLENSILDIEEQAEEAMNIARKATRQVNQLTEDLQKERQRIKALGEQISQNRQETKEAKKEASRANERIDNLLKRQQLSDFTSEQLAFAKLQKTLQLKADETKLLAQLNILNQTQKLLPEETPEEREWKVGIKEGTVKKLPRPEGMPLVAGSRWEQEYSLEELREMGWDVRLKDNNESAHLTNPDRRKPKKTTPSTTHKEQTAPETADNNQALREEVEKAKSQILEQVKEIQAQVEENISPLEQELQTEKPESEDEESEPTQLLEQQEKELRSQRASTKAQLTYQQKKATQTQKEITQLKSAITKEQNKLKKTEQSLSTEKSKPKKQELQTQKQESEAKLEQTQQQLKEKQEQLNQQQQQIEKSQEKVQEQTEKIEEIQKQVQSSQQKQAEKPLQQEISQAQAEASQVQQAELQQQWQQISEAQHQVIEEQAESQESPPQEESQEAQEQAEAEQEVEKAEEEEASSQNQMTYFMLLLIIFLLEYIVYKRNGLPGLVVLNIALAIAYYNKDKILEYQHLWNDYALIAGYITGNVLAYCSTDNPQYKWPLVGGYNALILAIWGYTKWKTYQAKQQKEKAQKKLVQATIKKELNQNQIPEKELPVKFYNWEEKIQEKPLTETKQFQTELKQAIHEQIEAKKQAEYIQQQAQIAQEQEKQAQELKEKQAQVEQALLESKQVSIEASAINVEGLEETFPGFQGEFQRVKDWLYSVFPQSAKANPLTVLLKEAKLSSEEKNILNQLHLNEEQMLNISLQSKKVKNCEVELRNKYSGLSQEQKLKLLNLGLEALGLKTPKIKTNLVKTRRQTLQEQANFDLSYEEKEATLQFFITRLALTEEQEEELDQMGIAFVNSSNWKTTPQSRQTLLNIGLSKIKLGERERENINQTNPRLTNQNETTLKTLAPLAQEYKYSDNLLKSIQGLSLKYSTLSFFTQQQILPDTNLEFGEVKDPYLILKKQIVEKEQKKIFKEQQEAEKEEIRQRIAEIRENLLPSLISFGQNNPTEVVELELPLYRERITYQDKSGITYGIENPIQTWTSIEALDLNQTNLFLAHGFKSAKTYDYFELLIWAWEKASPKIEVSENWEKWKNIDLEFTAELVKEWLKWGFSYEITKEWIDIGSGVGDAKYCYWLKMNDFTPEWVLNEGNEDELCEEFSKVENDLKPLDDKQLSWNEFLTQNTPLDTVWESYLAYQTQKLEEQLERNRQELEERGLIGEEIQNKKINLRELIPSLADYIDSRIQVIQGRTVITSSSAEIPSSSEQNQSSEQQPSTSRYDDLLANLSQEEQARAKKQKQRQEARRKLDDMEFGRREQNLEAKQEKFQQEEARRAKERELQEAELLARQQAFQARQQELREQEEKRLTSQAEQIETKKKMAEEALAIKQKEAELAEARKRAEIERIEKENQAEQERLVQRARLIEEEMKERLAQIALEDRESRQRIEKECQERQAQLEREILEQKRKNERDLMLKQQEMEKERQEKDEQINQLRKEAELAEENFQEMQSKISQEKEASARLGETVGKEREMKMAAGEVHKKALAAVMEYYLDNDEIESCTNISHNTPSGSALPSVRSLFSRHPEMRINLFNSKVMSSGESGEKVSMLTGAKFFYWNAGELTTLINKCLGNASYSKSGLEEKIKSISDPNFF